MTIEKILNCNAEQLEKMSDKELLSYFAPALQYTHVDKVVKKVDAKKAVSVVQKQKAAKVQGTVQAILALYGKQNTNT
jgi:hypothetical protein